MAIAVSKCWKMGAPNRAPDLTHAPVSRKRAGIAEPTANTDMEEGSVGSAGAVRPTHRYLLVFIRAQGFVSLGSASGQSFFAAGPGVRTRFRSGIKLVPISCENLALAAPAEIAAPAIEATQFQLLLRAAAAIERWPGAAPAHAAPRSALQ